MLWSIDSCKNGISADQYHMTVSRLLEAMYFFLVLCWQATSYNWSQAQRQVDFFAMVASLLFEVNYEFINGSPSIGLLYIIIIIIIIIIITIIMEEKILLTTMPTIKILFTINSLETRKEKTIHSKHYLWIPVDSKSTQVSLERVNLNKKNYSN